MKCSRRHKWKFKVLEFACCFLFGFFAYMTLEIIFRGHTYSLMGVCGGIGFYIIGQFNEGRRIGLLWQGLAGAMLITGMELIVGSILLEQGARMWNYSNQWGNYKGLICPLFSFAWFVLSVMVVFVDDWIRSRVFGAKQKKYTWLGMEK